MTKTSGRGMIGLIAAAAIVVGASVFFAVGSGITGQKPPERKDGQGKTLIGKTLLAGKDSKCQSNLGQLRGGISLATDPVEDTKPQTLDETRLGDQFYKCPVGAEQYVYDPQTGKVYCPHPGHEKY